MNKKRSLQFIGLLILIIGIFTIAAMVNKNKAWHSSDEILVIVEGYTMTLEEAIDNNVFIDGATQSYTTEVPNPGHNANEIWISVNGNEMTLQSAIAITNNLCGEDSPSSLYAYAINTGQFADEIEVSPGKSLQDAINTGDFCYDSEVSSYIYSWYTGPWGPCIDDPYDYNPMNCIQTRVVYCRRSDGQQVADSYCSGTKPSNTQDCDCLVW